MRTPLLAAVRTRKMAHVAEPDAIELLMRAHHAIAELFVAFESAPYAKRRRLAAQICLAVTVHSQIEQELFYLVARAALDGRHADLLLGEVEVGHATVTALLETIRSTTPDDVLFEARFKVLRDYLTLQAAEEEGELFPRVRESGVDLRGLGARLAARQTELEAKLQDEWAADPRRRALTAPQRVTSPARAPAHAIAVRT